MSARRSRWKCLSKIDEFRKARNTINTSCDHAILLEQGQVFDQGEPKPISKVDYRAKGRMPVALMDPWPITSGLRYILFLRGLFLEDVDLVNAGFLIRSAKGVELFGTTAHKLNKPIQPQERGAVLEARFDVTMWLTNGTYLLTVGLAHPYADTDVQYDLRYDALQFDVAMKNGISTTSVVNLDPTIEVEELLTMGRPRS